MSGELSGRTALITGGTQGLGLEIALHYLRAGIAGVCICGRDPASGGRPVPTSGPARRRASRSGRPPRLGLGSPPAADPSATKMPAPEQHLHLHLHGASGQELAHLLSQPDTPGAPES